MTISAFARHARQRTSNRRGRAYCVKARLHLGFFGQAAAALFVIVSLSVACGAQTLSPPLNLQARTVPGGVELLYNFSWNAVAFNNISRTPAWASGQGFKYFFFFTDSTAPQQPPGGGIDQFVTAGTTYTYTVAVNGVTVPVTITYQPACSIVRQCPAASGSPPTYSITCRAPADFYLTNTIGAPNATGTPTFGGAGTLYGVTLACLPGTINSLSSQGSCDGFYQSVSGSNCYVPPAPPPKPIRSCEACYDSGRACVKSGSGYLCKGTAK